MIIIFALLGFFVGALVNQLGSDLPARRALTRPHCPYCGRERPQWQWITWPAFLLGRADCPSCGAPIRIRFPLVEIGLAAMYAYLWIILGPDPSIKLIVYLVYSAVFALILVTDMERRLILNIVTYPAILFAFLASFAMPDVTWWSALLGGAIGFIFFLIAAVVGNRVFGSGAMGGGDVKLAAFIGLITGFPLIIEALVLTIVAGAVISFVLLITGLRKRQDYIPYGPFLVIGATITLLKGYPIAEWFLSL